MPENINAFPFSPTLVTCAVCALVMGALELWSDPSAVNSGFLFGIIMFAMAGDSARRAERGKPESSRAGMGVACALGPIAIYGLCCNLIVFVLAVICTLIALGALFAKPAGPETAQNTH